MDIMTAIQAVPGIGPALPYIVALIALCSALATALPAPTATSPGWYRTVHRIVHFVALNMGHAKAAAAAAVKSPPGA
ncbi:MAG: hypothetical protein ACREDC_00145 [Bradyrhizobium sp.]